MPADPATKLLAWSSERPVATTVIATVALVFLAYATLIQQELFVALWFLLLLFFAHLALRFVRAFERIAGAMERYVEGSPDGED